MLKQVYFIWTTEHADVLSFTMISREILTAEHLDGVPHGVRGWGAALHGHHRLVPTPGQGGIV